ncbi:hypothetical protein ACKWTF_015672 [Chironomus riparius]
MSEIELQIRSCCGNRITETESLATIIFFLNFSTIFANFHSTKKIFFVNFRFHIWNVNKPSTENIVNQTLLIPSSNLKQIFNNKTEQTSKSIKNLPKIQALNPHQH